MALSLIFDHAQERMTADRLGIVASGLEWNGSIWSGTWIDPVTHTLMLRPRPLEASWYTSSVGSYAKFGLADFELASGWEERSDQHWAGPWLALKDSATGGSLVSSADLGVNRGLYLAWFSYGSGDTFLQTKCGWSDSGDDSAGVAFHFWTDGTVDVLKDGAVVGQGRISGSIGSDVRRHQVFEVMLLPMRGRELLVYSKSGRGFVHLFSDIDLDDESPVITPAGKFWVEVSAGGGQLQVAPLQFSAEGFATSLKSSLVEAPLEGESFVEFDNEGLAGLAEPFKVFGHEAFGPATEAVSIGLVELDGSTEFEPDGERTDCRLRAELSSSDAGYTPFVFGGLVAFQSQSGLTDSVGGVEVVDSVLECALSVPDDPTRVTLDFMLADPEGLETVVPGLISIGNRPVIASLGEVKILDGYSSPGELDWHSTAEATTALVEVRDAWKVLESSVFAERVPLDGLKFSEAVSMLVGRSGVTDVVLSDPDFTLPFAVGAEAGEWGMMIEPGDSAGDWLERLMETFTSTWTWGFRPTLEGTQFYALEEADLPSAAALKLYGSVEDAVLVGGIAVEEAHEYVFRSFRQTVVEPEATEVRVTGVDPGTGRPIQAVRTDYDAQDVGALLGARPENWLGEIRRFGLVDPGLTRVSAVEQACHSLFAKMTRLRVLAEFSSSLLVGEDGLPLWRGDLVELDGFGLWRIRAFGCRFESEADGMRWRRGHYSVEKVG